MYNINSHISEKTGVVPADLKFGDFHGLHLQFALESEGEINEMSYLTKTRDAQKRLLERVNRIRADEFAGRTYVDSENNERRDAKRCTVFQPGQLGNGYSNITEGPGDLSTGRKLGPYREDSQEGSCIKMHAMVCERG